jgi:hypothetical protein
MPSSHRRDPALPGHRKLAVTVAAAAAAVLTALTVVASGALASPTTARHSVTVATTLRHVAQGHRHRRSHPGRRHRHHRIPTKFGASVHANGVAWGRAVARSDSWYHHLRMIRVFYPGLPEQWPGRAGQVNRPVAVSFKLAPSAVLSGKYDAYFTHWFRTAPRHHRTWWTYIHEPEDNIARGEFSASSYRAAWRHLYALSQRAHHRMLRPTLTLMCYTMTKYSHRRFSDYNPGPWIHTYAWDCYNRDASTGHYVSPQQMFSHVLPFTRRHHKQFAVAEFGSVLARGDRGAGRAAWLRRSARYLRRHDAAYVSYFDSTVGDDYRLLDAPSRRAWRAVVNH